jgi:lysophospholipase L1-like esterase
MERLVYPVKKILLGVSSFIIVMVLIELVSRIAATIEQDVTRGPDGLEQWFEYSASRGWIGKPGYHSRVAYREGSSRTFDADGFVEGEIARFADSTRIKIAFVGDSNPFGFDLPQNQSFVSRLDTLLEGAVTINVSTPAYSSYQGKLVIEDILQHHHPDILVMSFNYNDRRSVLRPADQDGVESFRRAYEASRTRTIIRIFEYSYTFRAVRFLLRHLGWIADPRAKDVRLTIDSLVPRVSPQSYRQNLIAMTEECRRHQVVPVFLLLSDNPINSQYLDIGLRNYNDGEFRKAAGNLSLALMHGSTSSLLARKVLLQAYRKLPDTAQQRRLATDFVAKRVYNGWDPIKPDRLYNTIMRAVAEQHQVLLIDAAAVLNRDPSVYFDFCHFDERGHLIVARLLADSLAPLVRSIQKCR